MSLKNVLLVAASCAALAGCGQLPHPKKPKPLPELPMHGSTVQQMVAKEFNAEKPAVRVVNLSGDFFVLRPQGEKMPASLANARVRIDFVGQDATVDDLLLLLEDKGLPVAIGWDDGTLGSAATFIANEPRENNTGSSFGTSSSSTSASGLSGTSSGFGSTSGSNNSVAQGGPNPASSGYTGSAGPYVGTPVQGSGNATQTQGSTAAGGTAAAGGVAGTAGMPGLGGYRADPVRELRSRTLPFRHYEGTVAGLFRRLQTSMGLSVWWQDGTIYMSPVGRYEVLLPQNHDIMQQVISELSAKGARNVVASLDAGTVSFVANGGLAENVIRPFLKRLGQNASELDMQVALVSVNMTDASQRGFDWSQLSLTSGAAANATATAALTAIGSSSSSSTSSSTSGTTGSTTSGSTSPTGNMLTFSPTASTAFFNNVLGGNLNIASAIGFLSTYGDSKVEQNIELRTLSGTRVNFRDGDEIPYIAGVSATTSSSAVGSGTVGSAQTSVLDTGLTLDLVPNFESNGGLVTINFDMDVVTLVEFVNLNAGNQLGSFTQPHTTKQRITDIVRVPVGETVVLGGMRQLSSTKSKNGPFGIFGIGANNKTDTKTTLFILLRPTVTVYKVADLDDPDTAILSDRSSGVNGESWHPRHDVKAKGNEIFLELPETPEPRAKAAIQPPEKTPVSQPVADKVIMPASASTAPPVSETK